MLIHFVDRRGKTVGSTYPKTISFRLVIEENERKGKDETAPEAQQARDESHKRAERCEVAECFSPEETRKRVLFQGLEDVYFLLVEQVGDQGGGFGGRDGETVQPQRGSNRQGDS